MQMYVAGFTEFLEKLAVTTYVFFDGDDYGECCIPELNRFIQYGNNLFSIEPATFSVEQLDSIVNYQISKIKDNINSFEEIWIESHQDNCAMWGEFFAKRIGAKHIMLTLNELFEGANKLYKEYKDFFWHMYQENRVYGIGVNKLFANTGYVPDRFFYNWCVEKEPIADIDDESVNKIRKEDINIAYIGRGNKEYVPTVIQEVRVFADKHKDKEIGFIFVGNSSCQQLLISDYLENADNISLTQLGNKIPIPRRLLKKLDVVIANSQTAYFCAQEGVKVVTVSSNDFMSGGVLGYDVHDVGDPNKKDKECEPISKVLDDLFFTKKYKDREFSLKLQKKADEVYLRSIEAYEKLTTIQYFDVCKQENNERLQSNKIFIARIIEQVRECRNHVLEKYEGLHIVVFGAGNYGKDCIAWAEEKGIRVEYLVDNDYSKQGMYISNYKIDTPEVIKNAKFDYVIICNVNNGFEIKNQIVDMGVDSSKCVYFSAIRYKALS